MNSFQGRNPSSFALWKVLVCVKLGPVGNDGPLPLASYSGHEIFFREGGSHEEILKDGQDLDPWSKEKRAGWIGETTRA